MIFMFDHALALMADLLANDTWTRTLTIVVALAGTAKYIGAKIVRFHTDFVLILTEHELLVQDYCDRTGKNIDELPTRVALKPKAMSHWAGRW